MLKMRAAKTPIKPSGCTSKERCVGGRGWIWIGRIAEGEGKYGEEGSVELRFVGPDA
jgi:hypothetical protein